MKLIVKYADGTQQTIDTQGNEPLRLAAKPGMTVHAVDAKTGKTAVTTLVKRVDGDLVIEDGTLARGTARIEGFFDECKPTDRCWAVLDVPEGAIGGGNGGGQVTITQDGQNLHLLGNGLSGGMDAGQELAFAHVAPAAVAAGLNMGWLGWVGGGVAAAGAAAGGGGGGGGGGGAPAVGPLTVRGEVAAGPVKTGTVDVYVYDKDGVLLGHALVHNDLGEYEIVIPGKGNYTGPLLLVARDADGALADNYLDEATNQLTNLGDSLAAIGVGTSSTVVISITPLTQFAALKMGVDVNAVNAANRPPADAAWIATMNHAVSEYFGVADILGAVVTINETDFRSADAAAAAYGVALARLSEMGLQTGSLHNSLAWLASVLSIANDGTVTTTDASLSIIDTDRTIPRTADVSAAHDAADALSLLAINLANVGMTRVIIALPVNAVAGDLVNVRLAGPNGNAMLAPHTVTAQDISQGFAAIAVEPTLLASVGPGHVVPTAIVTDANGDNASPVYQGTSFDSDLVAPAPQLALSGSHVVPAGASTVAVNVQYAGMAAGDTVRLQLDGQDLGITHVVTQTEANAGTLSVNVAKSALGADGSKTITATATDVAGNSGDTTGAGAVTVTLDTSAPTPALALQAGQHSSMLRQVPHVYLEVSYNGLAEGDVIQLQLDGSDLGTPHTVTQDDVNAGRATISVVQADLGADGPKNITAIATDAAGNAGATVPLTLVLDTVAPAPQLALAQGHDAVLNAGDTSITLDLQYAGMTAGDRVQLGLSGASLGTLYTVTQNDVTAGLIAFNVAKSALGADGLKNIAAQVTDAAGNAGTSSALQITLDTSAPAPTLALTAGQDNIVNASETGIDVVVSYPGLVAGDVVQLRLAGGNLGAAHTVTSGEVTAGSVTITVAKADLGADGAKAITANVTDTAGNTGSSAALSLTLDSVAAVPTLAIAAGEDRYLNAAETSVHLEVSFAGMAAGNTIQLQLDGSHFGTPYVVTSGDVTAGYATITVQRADLGGDGSTLAAVVASGTAGNAGSSNPIALIVDTSVPAPTLAIQAGEDNLLGAAESVLHLQVRDHDLKVGDVIQLQLGGSNLGTPYTVTTNDVAGGFATLNVLKADLGADGAKNLSVTVTDLAGNSGASPVLAVTLDSLAPTPTLAVQAGHDLLVNATEGTLPLVLSDAHLAEGDVVRLTLNGQSLGSPYTVTAADVTAGFATLNVSRASLGADGAKNIVASLTDAAGNAGNSNTLAVTLDTAVPAPVLALATGEDGVLNALDSAVHLSLTYAGMVAGDTLQMRLAGNTLGTPYTVTANDVTAGRVLLDVARTDLGVDGLKNLAVTATDAAGNSAASNGLAVTLDTTAPVPTLSVAPGQDNILNATETGVQLRVAYSGLAAGDVVQLNFAGNTLGTAHTVTAGEATAGYVSLNVAKADLGADGAKSLTVTATDVAGNSATSSALALTLDSVAAVPTLVFAPGQDGLLGSADTSVEVQVSFTGMAAGNSVQLRLAGVDFGAPYTVTAGDVTAGYATLSVSRASLGSDGSKSISVVATGTAGNAGASNALDVVVDTTAPTPTLSIATGEDNLLGAAESVLHVRASYAGLAAGDVIQLELGGFAFGGSYTVTGADVTAGYATLNVSRASLGGDGVKSLSITATDLAGNSGSSSPLAVTLDSVAPTPALAIAAGSDNVVNALETGVPVQVSYAGMAAGDVVQLQLAGSNVGVAYTVTSGDVTAGYASLTVAKSSLGSDGTKSLTAIATDAAGNAGTSATLSVLLDTTAPTLQFSNQTGALLTGAGLGLLGSGQAGVALVDGASTVTDGGPAAIGRVVVSLSGFTDGASERLAIGNAVLRGDGSATPATVTAGGTTWNVAYANGAFTFTPANGSASQADVAALMQASYNDLAGTITDGQRIVSYTATDVHGNVGNTVTSSVLVSTTPPAISAAIISLSADTGTLGDFITTTAAQSVGGSYSGTLNSGDRIQVSLDGSTWVDANITSGSTWVANGITLQAGSHDLYVRAINLAGNTTTPATHAYTLESAVIATTAVITAAWDDASVNGSSAGLLGSGHSTDDSTPTLTGTISQALTAGQVVALYDDGTRIGEATVNGTNWTYAVTTALTSGTNSLVAVVEHPASGAHSANSNTYVIDQQSITLSVLDDVGGQHGAITLGGATDDNLPHLTGTLGHAVLGPNEVIAIYDGSVRLGTATISGTSWHYDFASALTDGQHTLRAVIQDSAATTLAEGRVIGNVVQFVVDTSALAPTQTVSINAVADDATLRGSLSGSVDNGHSTDDRTPTLTGSISANLGANQVLAVYDTVNGVTTRLGEANVTGTAWTFTTSTLNAGTHAFTAVAESAASGAQGTVSNVFTVREQSITVTAIEDNVGIDIGNLVNLSLTDDDTPTIKGTLGTTLASGEVVAVYDGTTRIGNATVTGTNWVFTPSTPLNDGVHSLVAMVQDDATGTVLTGRVISESTQMTVLTLLSTPSQAVVITAASENNAANGSATGSFASGTSTDGTTPTLTGTLNANLGLAEVLAVYDNGTRVGLATVNGTSWSFTSGTLGLGSHSFTARVENLVSGATGTASSAYVVIEQSIAVSALTDDIGTTQGAIAANGVTDDNRPAYSGSLGTATLGAGEVVAIYDGSTKLGNATIVTTQSGTSWSFTPAGALADGSHSLRAVVQDGAATSPTGARLSTATSSFTVNTSAVVPTQTTTIGSVNDNEGTLTGNLTTNTSTDDRTPTLSGTISATLDAGQAVAIYDGSTRLGYASVTGTSWTYTTSSLTVGSHSFTAVVENQATGAQGPASSAFVVNEQSVDIDNLLGITGAVQVLVGGLLNVVLGTNPNFTGSIGSATLGANEVVAVYDGSTKLGNATLNGSHWGFTPPSPLSTGFHQITVAIQDASSTNLAAARVSSSVANLTVDAGLLVPTQVVTIDWAIESSATNGSVTGQFASGTSTDGTTPSIGGSVSASLTGAQVIAVYDGAVKLGNATVTGQSWSFTTTTLTAGSHTLTARVENPTTGSAGPASGGFVVLEQSLSAITVTDDIGSITGSVAQGGYTDDKRPTFSGTLGSAGLGLLETVAIYDTVNGVTTKLGDAVVNGTSWSFTPIFLAPMADGAHSVKAVVQPLLSLSSAGTVVSAPYNFIIDSSSTPLQTISLNSVTDTLALGGSIIGAVLSGGTTDDTTPTLNGTLSAALTGAQAVAVYDNGVKLGYATVDGSNPLKFSYTPDGDLSAGTHNLTARVENTATGSQGLTSSAYVIVERPITLKITDNVGALQGDVLSYDHAVTDDTSLLLSGAIGSPLLLNGLNLPLERVRVYDNGNFVGNATVNGTDWSYNLTGLSAGTHHDISVRITDLTGLIYTVATGGSFDVATSELSTTADTGYTSSGSVARVTLGGHANSLDLTQVGGASQPQIDVVQAGTGNSVKLALADVLQGGTNLFNSSTGWAGVTGTGKHQMVIDASGSGSSVNVTDGSWSSVGSTSHNGHSYTVYENSTHLAQLLIDTQLTRSGTVGG